MNFGTAFGGTVQPIISKSTLEQYIDQGVGYSLSIEVEVVTGATKHYALRVPAGYNVDIVSRSVSTGGGLRYKPIKGATFTLGSEIVGAITNLNERIGTASPVAIYDATGVSGGTAFDIIRTPSTQGSSGNPVTYSATGSKRALESDTDYILEFANIDNSDIWCIYSLVFTAVSA